MRFQRLKIESDARAASGEKFVLRFRVPRESGGELSFEDLVYGLQAKAIADVEDFALLGTQIKGGG